MNLKPGMKALVTTDAWFIAPDGREYRHAFGTVEGIFGDKDTLGIATNRNSTNWYLKIGCLVIAGCQIHYAAICGEVNTKDVTDWKLEEGKVVKYKRPSMIYLADAVE